MPKAVGAGRVTKQDLCKNFVRASLLAAARWFPISGYHKDPATVIVVCCFAHKNPPSIIEVLLTASHLLQIGDPAGKASVNRQHRARNKSRSGACTRSLRVERLEDRRLLASAPGDFNDNDIVDAADYTLWQDAVGTNTPLANDDQLGTPIGNAHYALWKANFGRVAPVNTPPVAKPDVLLTTTGQPAVVDYLLANDTDADGDLLTLASYTDPAHATLSTNTEGQLVYAPTANFAGADSFDYEISDDQGGTATGTVRVSVNAPLDAPAARTQILAGVSSLANPIQPGHMVTFGPTAYSIANYPGADLGDPMIAAATLGQGRVIALPDHQWLNMDSHDNAPSMAALYQNSVRWLADSTGWDTPLVTYDDQDNADWLTSRGFTQVVNATAATLGTYLVEADVLVGAWLGSNVPDEVLTTVGDFVANGGGLLVCEYGIGYQWWWNKPTEEIPGNRLLRLAGIGFVKQWPHGSSSQSVTAASGQVTASGVLDLLTGSGSLSQAETNQASEIFNRLNLLLAQDDSLQARLDAGFWDRVGTINPTPATPVTDAFEKALLTREMNLIGDLPPAEVTAHRTAEAVYGTIDTEAARLTDHTVTIDTSRTGLIATGMYVVPGETVTVTVPASLAGDGYRLRVNTHVDDISGRASWQRVPSGVSRSFELDSTSVAIASAFGGAIYIDVGGQAAGTPPGLGLVDVVIDGAIEAPRFVLGETTDAQWRSTLRNHPAPYADFVSGNVAFNVPSAWIRNLDNPEGLMQHWHDAVALQDWVGGFEGLRTGPDRINYDVQISGGLLHAGYPIQGPVSYGDAIVDLEVLQDRGDWGWFHELGHEMQRHPELDWGWDNVWTFPGDVEVTVNIFANAALEFFAPQTSGAGWGWSAHADQVMERAVDTTGDPSKPNFDQKNAYPFYFQLADGAWGWQGYRNVLSTYVQDALNHPDRLPTGGQQEKDQWLVRWSEHNEFDMTGYMVDHWGLEVSQSALDAVAAMGLPGWMPLATSTGPLTVTTGETKTIDLAGAGLSLDGTATLVAVGQPTSGGLNSDANGTYTYVPAEGFTGSDPFEVTYRSSAGNEQTFTIDVLVEQRGPIASWNFDEGSGTTASDQTGGGSTGQVDGASWTEGYAGGALEFDGIDDQVLLGTGPSLEGLTNFTVMAMVRTTATSGGILIQQRNGGYNGEYILKMKADGRVNFWMYGDSRYQFNITSPGAIHDGQWHHVAAGRNGDDGFLYIDGQLAATGSGSVVNLRSHIGVGIGADIRDNHQYFQGTLDEMAIYDLALSGEEITQQAP